MTRLSLTSVVPVALVCVLCSAVSAFCMSFAVRPAAQEPESTPEDDVVDSSSPVTLLRGMDVPVRGREEAEITPDTITVSYEAFYDWDFGAVTLVSQTGDIAAMPPMRNWVLRTAPNKLGDLVVMCFRPTTGETYLMNGEGQWEAIVESADVERLLGDYEVVLSVSNDGLMSAVRMDRLTGRTWVLEEGGWKPSSGNLQGWPE